ncbi:MAG: hypothetical protein JJT89_02710 [Nitriliruptoraceae bacterium]|nr:hypothetical protein [Nitriliruptoraceae bacterium]
MPTPRAGWGIGIAAAVVATFFLISEFDPRADLTDVRADDDRRDTVEVARPGTPATQPAGGEVADLRSRAAEQRALRPPPCLVGGRETCAEPLLDRADLISAVPVVFGAVVVDTSLTLHRLQMVADRSQVRWTTEASVTDPPATAPAGEPTPTRLERTGTTLLLGTPSHLHVFDSVSGQQRWAADLGGYDDGSPWRGWVVDDTVVAVTSAAIVALDAGDGSLRWHRPGPFQDVLPLASGVAVIHDRELQVFGPDDPAPRWGRPVAPAARFPAGEHPPNHGPVVLTGRDAAVLDASTGEELVGFDTPTAVTRTSRGQVVAAVWDDQDAGSTLVGYGIDGIARWRVPGPPPACCHVELRPTADGDVIALFPGDPQAEGAWIVDPTTGAVRLRITRPGDVGWAPRAVVGSTVIWMDGTAFVGADAEGVARWRAESQAELLSTAPLLLGTRDGLIRPPTIAADDPWDRDGGTSSRVHPRAGAQEFHARHSNGAGHLQG